MAELNNTIVNGSLRVTDSIYANTVYENGTSLSAKYLGISAKAADSDKLDNHDSSYFATATHTHSAIDITLSDISTYTNVKQAIGDLYNRVIALETALDGLLTRLSAI